MGNMILAASTKSSGTSFLPLILIVVLFMVVYMTFTRRNRARQAQQMQSTLIPGTRVRTTSGMYGTVVSVDGDDVLLEVAPGVTVRMMRRAVVPAPMNASTGGPSAADGTGPVPGAEDDDHDAADDRNHQDRNV